MASALDASIELDGEASRAAATIATSVEGEQAIVPILGARALLSYRLDPCEDERRKRAHLGAIRHPEVLDLLLALPIGFSVPVTSLTPLERLSLRLAPAGAVAIEVGSVTRQAVYPLAVDLAVIAIQSWRTGLEIVGRFAPFCARMMLLRQWPKDVENLRMQAHFYGIGVVVANGADVEVVIAPRPFRRRRFTASGWQFLEQVYHHVR
jgi:hypothetical protein